MRWHFHLILVSQNSFLLVYYYHVLLDDLRELAELHVYMVCSAQTVHTISATIDEPIDVDIAGDTPSTDITSMSLQTLSTAIHDILSLIKGNVSSNEQMSSKNAAQSSKKFRKCFCIFSHGSYNPPHNDHIQMLISAREMILSKHQNSLVIGFIGHTSQNWMKNGKGLPPTDRFSDEHRRNMLILAISDLPWLYYAEDGPKFHSSRGLNRKYVMEIQEEIKKHKECSKNTKAFEDMTVLGVDVLGSDTRGAKYAKDDCIVVMRDNTTTESSKENFPSRKERKSSEKRMFPRKEDQLLVGKPEETNHNGDGNVYIEKKDVSHENSEISAVSEISHKLKPYIIFDYKKNLIQNTTVGHSSTLVRKALKDLKSPKNNTEKEEAEEYLKFALHPKVRTYIEEIGDKILNEPLKS